MPGSSNAGWKDEPCSGLRQADLGEAYHLPPVIGSWIDCPPEVTESGHLIGGKAQGLLRLPRQWVPPFFVLTGAFYSLWEAKKKFTDVLNILGHEHNSLIQQFFDSILPKHSQGTARLLVRSNAPAETLSLRGAHESYVVAAALEEIAEAIDTLLSKSRPSTMYVLVQVCIDPSWAGHMSNERRVSRKRDTWLIEGFGRSGDYNDQQFVRPLPSPGPKPLLASTESEARKALRKVAGELARSRVRRFHCEWVWDGHRVWIVQCDGEADRGTGGDADLYLRTTSTPTPSFASRSLLRHFREVDWKIWRKLRCPGTFASTGLPFADIYVLTGRQWKQENSHQRAELLRNLAEMCRHPVVVRCDVAEGVGYQNVLLPTSPATTDVNRLLAFMAQTADSFASEGLKDEDWAFLLAFLVPARASAMIHARPNAQRVRVDALWGFPDGLLHFPHDSWFYDTVTGRAKQLRRHKNLCLLPKGVQWVPSRVGAPFDWQSVLSLDEVSRLSQWGLQLANSQEEEIELMALARINGQRGPDACLPWHFTDWKVPQYSQSLRVLPYSSRPEVVKSYADLEVLRSRGALVTTSGYLVSPTSDLFRDSTFLTQVATLAVEHRKPVLFEGSLLGHAYYIMSRTGAHVIPVTRPEPRGPRRTYRKLVRDLIPVIIREAGGIARVRRLTRSEAVGLLLQKLIEEAFEVWTCPLPRIIEELADVLEVAEALRREVGIATDDLDRVREQKRKKRGGFDQLIYLEETDVQSLRAPSEPAGRLPLFPDDAVSPSRRGPRASKRVRVSASGPPDEICHLAIPLVPPVDDREKSVMLELKALDVQLHLSYTGAELIVRLRRPPRGSATNQLLLFPELRDDSGSDDASDKGEE